MTHFQTFAHLSTIDLGAPRPKPTTLTGNQFEASVALFKSNDGLMEIGVWECTPGRFTAVRDTMSETCHIVSGHVTLPGPEGLAQDVRAGERLVRPNGRRLSGELHPPTPKP